MNRSNVYAVVFLVLAMLVLSGCQSPPEALPNLRVTDVKLFVSGDEDVFVRVEITNDGNAATDQGFRVAFAVSVEYHYDTPGPGLAGITYNLEKQWPALAAGFSHVEDFEFPVPQSARPARLHVEVLVDDRPDVITESNEDDNQSDYRAWKIVY